MDERLGPRRQQRSQPFGRAARQPHGRLPGWKIDHPHVAPEHSPPQSGAQRLGAGLLGGESLSVGRRASGSPIRAALFGLGEATGGKTLPVPGERLLNALDIAKIAADPDDQSRRSADARPSVIAKRIAFTASASPTKIASPMRKWPMLSSTICGKTAMRRAVS